MRDGFWTLVNARAWAELPEDLQQSVTRNINAAALNEREDLVKMRDTMQEELAHKGMVFNPTDTAAFRTTTLRARYYW